MRQLLIAIAMLAAASVTRGAHAAVTFPPEAQWTPFHCGAAPMTDPYADDAQYLLDLDLVGDNGNAAGYHASDATNLYLRIRLDADPTTGGVPKASAWGYEFDLDNDPSTYELLISVDGLGGGGGVVTIYANTQTTIPNSPTDPANIQPLASYPFAMNARAIQAPGSAFGGTADFFLDFAVPWSALVPNGLDHTTSVRVWAGSSSTSTNLDGDIACDDQTNGAAPVLDGTASTATPADPGNGGGGPGGPGELVGGEHCQVGGGGGLVLLGAVAFLLRRRR